MDVSTLVEVCVFQVGLRVILLLSQLTGFECRSFGMIIERRKATKERACTTSHSCKHRISIVRATGRQPLLSLIDAP